MQETGSPSLTVLLTATGIAGHAGDPAARLVVEGGGIETGSATNLSMEARTVEDSQRIASAATLGAARLVSGLGNLGAKVEISPGEENVANLLMQ